MTIVKCIIAAIVLGAIGAAVGIFVHSMNKVDATGQNGWQALKERFK